MRALKWVLTTFVVLFILAPLIVVAVVSFNQNRYMDFPPEGFSLHWYAELWNDVGWRDAIVTSLLVAATSAALAVVIATPMAFVLRAYDIRLAPAIFALGILPFLLPPVISALGALVFWSSLGFSGRLENIIISHAIFFSTLPLITASEFLYDSLKIESNAFVIVSVRTYVPLIIETPRTIASAVRAVRSFRPRRPLSANRTIQP